MVVQSCLEDNTILERPLNVALRSLASGAAPLCGHISVTSLPSADILTSSHLMHGPYRSPPASQAHGRRIVLGAKVEASMKTVGLASPCALVIRLRF